ncbi:MAG: hypothetical protein NPIRA06_26170 [Nitrospirales bacterium]|nr:MAG: hypothetical protein NPIRA06_26170 [Nitrospirales bacterium]
MITISRAMFHSVFICVLILMGGMSCVEVNIKAISGKKVDAQKKPLPPGFIGEIEVRTAADILLEPDDVKEILKGANTVADLFDGIGDTECPMDLKIKPGGIPKFDAPQVIRDRHDLKELNDTYNGVKVVKRIRWCNKFWPNILGCQKYNGIVVVRTHSSQEGVLWLHEYGHLRGLEHRNQHNAVMNEFIGPTNTMLNDHECNIYR